MKGYYKCKFHERNFLPNTQRRALWPEGTTVDTIQLIQERCISATRQRQMREEFAKKHTLKKHVTAAHDKVVSKCEFCGKFFVGKVKLENHVDSVHPRLAKHKCKFFTVKGSLKDHVEAVHLGIDKHECNFCERRFTQAHNLGAHVESAHMAENRFGCDRCEKAYSQRASSRSTSRSPT